MKLLLKVGSNLVFQGVSNQPLVLCAGDSGKLGRDTFTLFQVPGTTVFQVNI
jgi:hypothetical protein